MKFSDKVFYLRKKKGLTQTELAEKANVSQGMIWLFEAGRRKPAKNTEIQLAKVLGVKPADLMDDEKGVAE